MPRAQPGTTVVNKHHGTPYDVYIGRPSIWGNPFGLDKGADEAQRRRSLLEYEIHLLGSAELLTQLHTLRGRALACFCAPKPCHGDVLARYADDPEAISTALESLRSPD